MDKVVMPELITPAFAEMIADNPEILRIIADHQPGEEVIVGQNCTLDCNCNPTNVKLVLCNVTIAVNHTEDGCGEGCGAEEAEEQADSCHIEISDSDYSQEDSRWSELQSEVSQLKLEVAVLEARMEEAEKILRLIPRQMFNRKLVARCKKDINDAAEESTAKKKELEELVWLMEFGQ